jgi:hypothetical protein
VRAAALVALGVGVIAASPRVARAEPYKDEKLGFSINAPTKWKRMPLAPDEKWVAASFQCERDWEVTDPKTNSYDRHRPQLDVVILPTSETTKKGGVTVDKEAHSITVEGAAEYKDFKDYLDKTAQRFGGGGYFFSEEKETKIGGMKVMTYEITFDKLANAPRKRWGWAFYAPDAVYGVTADALIKWEKELRPDIEAAFKSFKVIPHSQALGGAAETGKSGSVTVRDPSKKETPEERKKRHEDEFNAYLARAKEQLADGWKTKESKHFVVFTHTDDKTTDELLNHSETLRGWLDDALGFMGSGDPGRTILRICANHDEYMALWKTGGEKSWRFEIYTYKDREFAADSRLWELNQGLYRLWIDGKNDELAGRMPGWIEYGLRACIRTGISKGKKIEFKATVDESQEIQTLVRGKGAKLIPGKDFLTKDIEAIASGEHAGLQCESFVRFLMVGSASHSAKYKNLFTDYMKNLVALVDEEANNKDSSTSSAQGEPQSEEEENARVKERQNRWKEREKELLQKLIDQTFKGWDAAEWDGFNKSYWKDLGA